MTQEKSCHAVGRSEEHADLRVISGATITVHQGGTIEMATLLLDPQGVHKGERFHGTIAWPELAITTRESNVAHLLAVTGEAKPPI